MKAAHLLHSLGLALLLASPLFAADPIRLDFQATSTGLQLSWDPAAHPLEAAAELRVESSENLVDWDIRARVILEKARTDPWQAEFPRTSPKAFFRVASQFDVDLVRAEGADVLGYDDRFSANLRRIGQITPQEFAARYPSPMLHVPALTWDPTQAAFFEEYNTSPEETYLRDFTLNPSELASFRQHGFVVSTRLNPTSFGDLYYQIFVRDLPVYVTADSILHAWHRSFDTILEQTEDAYLYTLLEQILHGMASALPALAEELPSSAWSQSLQDADYYLAVARTLLSGTNSPSHFNAEDQINAALDAITAGKTIPFNLFGRLDRDPAYQFDFSQFKVRSHYVNSARLGRYFQAMMWCGRVDLRVAGNPAESSARELGTALVLSELLTRSGQLENWSHFDRVIQTYIGRKDSMDPLQMANVRQLAEVNALSEITDPAGLDRIRDAIESGSYGIQQILGDIYWSPFGPEQVWLPRSFGLLGQRFAVDGWALGKVVFDRIIWDENGTPDMTDKVQRRRASGLDIAFSVLGNNTPVPEIIGRISNPSGHPFRDGYPYQHNLAATRETVDQQNEEVWRSSTYYQWLAALRALSPTGTVTGLPESMRTRAWTLRHLNTQLASWSELRHDTVLYSRQSYIPPILCFYPAGFVEPVPQFWERMRVMASETARLVAELPMHGMVPWEGRYGTAVGEIDLATVQSNQVQFLSRFAGVMAALQEMARKELAQEPFSPEETAFIENLVEDVWKYWGTRTYTGWYPGLFYLSNEGSDPVTPPPSGSHDSERPPMLVTDVLTASQDFVSGDPGAVLHEAVGRTAFMMVAVDNGPDRMVFGGPVYTYYEFERPLDDRLTDAQWTELVRSGDEPPLPDWTQGWLLAP